MMIHFRNEIYNVIEKALMEWCAHVHELRGQDISVSSVIGTRLKVDFNATDFTLENMDLNEFIVDVRPYDSERDFFLHDEEASGYEGLPKNLPEESEGFSYTKREQEEKGDSNV